MSSVFVIDLESVPSRYTYYLKDHLPEMIRKNTHARRVYNIDGGQDSVEATEGAFLNFNLTNVYKSNQVSKMAGLIESGDVEDGDVILFADAWNPGILNIRYMIDLAGLDVELHGVWHAGSYDPQDFLGRKIKDKRWSYAAETAFFHALDKSYFATYFHIELFTDTITQAKGSHKLHRTGLPMEYIQTLTHDYYPLEKLVDRKENLICFPHRIAPEKNVDLFKEVMCYLPDYDYIICQEHDLSKKEYYDVLARSAIVFSANKQETLGISSCLEGPMFMSIPLNPNRLSYREVFDGYDDFLYPSNWTEEDLHMNVPKIANRIKYTIENYDHISKKLIEFNDARIFEYMRASRMYNSINNSLLRT